MKYIVVSVATILLLPIIFREPSAKSQQKDPIIVTSTAEQKEARVLSAENDKRSLAINKDIAIVTEQTVPNNKLRSEVLKYKRKVYSLQRENNYYKRKIVTLKKVLKINYGKEPEFDKTTLDNIIYKTDTVYLPTPKKKKKGFFKIFN